MPCHSILGDVYCSKGEAEKSNHHHHETTLRIASPSSWYDQLFWVHYSPAMLSAGRGDAHAHVERAKSSAINDAYYLSRGMELLSAKVGAAKDAEECRDFRDIGETAKNQFPLVDLISTVPLHTPIYSPFSVR